MQPSETENESREQFLARLMRQIEDRDTEQRAWLAEAIVAVSQAKGTNDQRLATAQAALTVDHSGIGSNPIWWDPALMRQFLIRAACPIVCRGVRDPDGEDWHASCEQRAEDALRSLAGVAAGLVSS